MAKLLVTGATGFIGRRVVRTLQTHHEIFPLVKKIPKENHLQAMRWIEQDLTVPLEYSRLPGHVDAIFHVAQSRLYKRFPEAAEDVFDINVNSTFELLEYARKTGVQYFAFASSGGVYGYNYQKFAETEPVSPLDFYLSSKHMAEILVTNYKKFFRTVIFRFFFVYGPGQEGLLIPTLLKKVLNGEPITIEGNPGIRINPIYVEDAVRVFESALHLRASDLFNIAGDENITITDLVKMMENVVGKKAIVRHTDHNPQRDLIGDNTRMKEVLGVYPQTPLSKGLRYML